MRGYIFLLILVVLLLALVGCGNTQEPIREFHHFGLDYAVDTSKIVMYQLAVPNLHGTMTLDFDRNGKWSGNYSLTHSKINARFFFDTFESEMFSFDFTNLSCENVNSCKITVNTQRSILKNVDPYGMQIVGVRKDPVRNQLLKFDIQYENFGEFELTSNFTITFSQIRETSFSFQYYMQGVIHPVSNMRASIPISFPRDVSYHVDEYKTSMSILLSFDNAPIIDKSQLSLSPKILLQTFFTGLIPNYYTSIYSFQLWKTDLN
ncbi:predicted protein, partial [Naegleria gruberi]